MSNASHIYDFSLQFDIPTSTHHIQMRMVPEGSFVLDIGCHTGIVGQALMERKNAKVVGIDYDEDAVSVAKTKLADAFTSDIETPGWTEKIRTKGYSGFDVIILGDVLEHTRNPEVILREARTLLKPEGRIIVSIPNVAYWDVRIKLLLGRFDYTDTGTLDRTHLRFFTHKTARELILNAGLTIIEEDVSGIKFPKWLFRMSLPAWFLRLFPGLFGFQFIAAAK